MNQLATDYLIGRFHSHQMTADELMRRVEAEVRREVAAEIEQLRGERDETARELAKEKADHADTQRQWNEALDMLTGALNRGDPAILHSTAHAVRDNLRTAIARL